MRTRLILMLTCAAWLFAANSAAADVRTATVDDPQDTPVDVNGNYNHQDIQQVRVAYDTAGTLQVVVRFYAPVPPASSSSSFDRPYFSFTLGSGVSSCTSDSDSSFDADVSFSVDDGDSSEDSIRIAGLEGAIVPTRSVSPDGREVSIQVTHPALTNRGYKCGTSGDLFESDADDSTRAFKLLGPGAYRAQPYPAPACTAAYMKGNPPALAIDGLPSKLAFRRQADFRVINQHSGRHGFPYRSREPATLTIKGSKEKRPFADRSDSIVGQSYFLSPEPKEGRSHTVSLSYVEGRDPTGRLENGNCRRVITRKVSAVRGYAPDVKIHKHNWGFEFTVRTRGQRIVPGNRRCSLTRGGPITLKVRAPDASRRLVLRDACRGKWGRTISGRGWRLGGDDNPDEYSAADASFIFGGRKLGTKHYYIAAFFEGRRLHWLSFNVVTSLRKPIFAARSSADRDAQPAASEAVTASVHGCSQSRYYIRYRLGAVASIMSVRDMSCRSALKVVKRHGRSAGGGRHFRLGSFRCTRYYQNYEDNKARCVSGNRAFRVDYGS